MEYNIIYRSCVRRSAVATVVEDVAGHRRCVHGASEEVREHTVSLRISDGEHQETNSSVRNDDVNNMDSIPFADFRQRAIEPEDLSAAPETP